MILVFETNSLGTHHAPVNSAILETIAQALPNQKIRVHADPTHLAELRNDPFLASNTNIEFRQITTSPHYRIKMQIVSIRRFWREFVTFCAALRQVPRGDPCLLVLLSATPTAILATSLLARGKYRRIGVQICLHGNLDTLGGWRSRNPLIRHLDENALLAQHHPQPFRYLVFEDSVKQELLKLVPQAVPFTDVLPHPANTAEVGLSRDHTLQEPIRVGLVGQATEAKGVTPFLETARLFKRRHAGRVQFFLVGRIFPDTDLAQFDILDAPVSTEQLSREAFRTLLGSLQFVFLPLHPDYYNRAASGALLDAITWLKPIIATRVPIVTGMFARNGDIGYLCDSVEDMQQTLATILREMDASRYAKQVEALRLAREARLPEALAHSYEAIMRDHFAEVVRVND